MQALEGIEETGGLMLDIRMTNHRNNTEDAHSKCIRLWRDSTNLKILIWNGEKKKGSRVPLDRDKGHEGQAAEKEESQ